MVEEILAAGPTNFIFMPEKTFYRHDGFAHYFSIH